MPELVIFHQLDATQLYQLVAKEHINRAREPHISRRIEPAISISQASSSYSYNLHHKSLRGSDRLEFEMHTN